MAHFQLLSSHFQLGVFSAWCSELAVAKKKEKKKKKEFKLFQDYFCAVPTSGFMRRTSGNLKGKSENQNKVSL